ncbi:fibrinogen-like YCDxxxxGGGW domain-containing protein [Aeromonas media]|uniref:fibrinogen-like YCDxxxxGGGW domain-containing protein n=1 Tax=Aeromonas media TaxID=651 RepID=UPI003D2295F0
MKKIISGLVLAAISIGAANADQQYIIKIKADGIIDTQSGPVSGSTCLEIKKKAPNSKSGKYQLTINGKSIGTYCDMEFEGGGWTMVQARTGSATKYIDSVDIGGLYMNINANSGESIGLPDAEWQALVARSTHLMSYYNSSAYAYLKFSEIQKSKCKKLSPTLKTNLLLHDEDFGCKFTGSDYAFMGADRAPYLASTYHYSQGVKYDVEKNTYANIVANGMFFVR